MNPYETLGVEKDADEDAIKKAYRAQAKAHHPDAGGEREAFEKVSRAYMVLSNPKARQRYDDTGEINEQRLDDDEARVLALIAKFIDELAECDESLLRTDLVALFRQGSAKMKAALNEEKSSLTHKSGKLERVAKRFSRTKDDPKDPVADILRNRIASLKRQVEKIEDQIRWHDMALTMMDAYRYAADPLMQQFNPYTTTARPGASFFSWNT